MTRVPPLNRRGRRIVPILAACCIVAAISPMSARRALSEPLPEPILKGLHMSSWASAKIGCARARDQWYVTVNTEDEEIWLHKFDTVELHKGEWKKEWTRILSSGKPFKVLKVDGDKLYLSHTVTGNRLIMFYDEDLVSFVDADTVDDGSGTRWERCYRSGGKWKW